MDADIESAEGEPDTAMRKAIWADMQQIHSEQRPVLPWFFRSGAQLTPTWRRGDVAAKPADPITDWAEHWRPG